MTLRAPSEIMAETRYFASVIVIYYTDFGAISNNNSNILIYKVIVIVIDF